MMPIVTPLRDGLRRVLGAPVILLGAWALTVAVALPLGLLLRGELQVALGETLTPGTATNSIAWDWWQQIADQTGGIGRLFTPPTVVTATLLSDLNHRLNGEGPGLIIGMIAAVHLIVWNFLAGGILDRYARNRPTRSAGFFSACGFHVTRLLRLALIAGLAYAILFGVVFDWLCDGVNSLTSPPPNEDQPLVMQLLIFLPFGLLLIGVNLVFDYARIRTVVEDRRSMIGAVLAGWRFVLRHAGACIGLYLVNGLALVASIAFYTTVAPDAGPAWAILLIGHAYIVTRLVITLLFSASEVSYFQSQLAHAGYVAAPPQVWPESPTAEALGRIS